MSENETFTESRRGAAVENLGSHSNGANSATPSASFLLLGSEIVQKAVAHQKTSGDSRGGRLGLRGPSVAGWPVARRLATTLIFRFTDLQGSHGGASRERYDGCCRIMGSGIGSNPCLALGVGGEGG